MEKKRSAIENKLFNLNIIDRRDPLVIARLLNNRIIDFQERFPFSVNELENFFRSKHGQLPIKYSPLPEDASKNQVTARQLFHVSSHANKLKYDYGQVYLFVASCFVSGYLPISGKFIRAPLLLKPVFINFSANEQFIVSTNDSFVPNETLLYYLIQLEKQSYTQISKFVDIWNNISILGHELELCDFLVKNFNLSIENNRTGTHKFSDKVLIEDLENDKRLGFLELQDGYILGIFDPYGKKIYQDYHNLLTEEGPSEMRKAFELGTSENNNFDSIKAILEDNFLAEITPLNLSQLQALASALNGNTIIHGPPGTGKSETITNIIFNCLLRNKTALICSEKKAARDVLLSRLTDFSDFVLDQFSDVNKFYEKLGRLNEIYSAAVEPTSLIATITKEIIDSLHPRSAAYQSVVEFDEKVHTYYDLSISIQGNSYQHYYFHNFLIDWLWTDNPSQWHKKVEALQQFAILKYSADELNAIFEATSALQSLGINSLEEIKSFYGRIEYLARFWNELKNSDNNSLRNKLTFDEINQLRWFMEIDERLRDIAYEDPFAFEKYLRVNQSVIDYAVKNKIPTVVVNNLRHDLTFSKFLLLSKNLNERKKIALIEKWLRTGKLKNSSLSYSDMKNVQVDPQHVLNLINIFSEINLKLCDFHDSIMMYGFLLNATNIIDYFEPERLKPKFEQFIVSEWFRFDPELLFAIISFDISRNDCDRIQCILKFQNDHALVLQNFNDVEFIKMSQCYDTNIHISHKNIKNLAYKLFIINWVQKINSDQQSQNEVIEIFRQSKLQQRPNPIDLIRRYYHGFHALFPILFGDPETIVEIVPLKKNIFNYGIFDEASQMFLERAYPIVYRSKIKVVAGDEKQLRPSNFFRSRYDSDDAGNATPLDQDEKFDYDVVESLLERAKVSSTNQCKWNEILLNNHYRSVSRYLMQFSNEYIYGNKLNVVSKNIRDYRRDHFVSITKNGYFNDGINVEEADEVVRQVGINLDKYGKIIVIAFNYKQSDLILDKLLDHRLVNKIRSKMDAQKLIITNLENVQGDEADLVIISVTYAPHGPGERLYRNFGPISKSGGSNRINVIASRAKEKMIVVKSITATDWSSNPNTADENVFYRFIVYCDQIEKREKTNPSSLDFTSPMEKEIYDAIFNLTQGENLNVLYKYQIGSESIDFAIKDENNIIKLGIKIDDYRHYLDVKNCLVSYDYQKFIENRGINIYRINEIDWYLHNYQIINAISRKLS